MTAAMLNQYIVEIATFTGPALLASSFFSILLYMFGKALGMDQFMAKAKENLAEVFGSALLILIIPSIFALLNTVSLIIANDILPTPAPTFIDAAILYASLLRERLVNIYLELYVFEFIVALGSTFGFEPLLTASLFLKRWFPISLPTISIFPLAGFTPLAEAQGVVVETMGFILSFAIARVMLLEFIKKYGVLFLALGLALRSFIFTKRTGTGLMALSLAAIFVYPLSTILTQYLIFNKYNPTPSLLTPTVYSFCVDSSAAAEMYSSYVRMDQSLEEEADNAGVWNSLWNAIKTFVSAFIDAWVSLFNVVKGAFTATFNAIKYHTLSPFGAWLKYAGRNLLGSPLFFGHFYDMLLINIRGAMELPALFFFSFVLEIVITFTAYRSIALALDEELDILGLTKLV